MTRRAAHYVADILAEMERAEAFVAGLPIEAFTADDKTVYAVIRALEVMGEAAKHVPADVRARCPEVSWRAMAGMRATASRTRTGKSISHMRGRPSTTAFPPSGPRCSDSSPN